MSNVKMPEPVKYLYRVKHFGNEVLVEYFSRDDEIIEALPLITTEQAEAYARAVRDEALARQATVAYRAIDNAKALASTLHAEAQRLNAESNPDALASERQANAILTAEVESLRKDAERYRWLRVDTATSAIPRVWLSNESAEPLSCLHGQDLDDTIDTTMKEQS